LIAQDILDRAQQRGLMITTAESCTGGMVAAALTEIPGSSAVVERGFVTYSNISKIEMLDVSQTTLEAYGAVSEQVAREMAEGALSHSAAQLALSITGIAGPGGSEKKPEGRVCFGLARTGHHTVTETLDFGPLGRKIVRERARDHALKLLLSYLSQ